MSEFTLTSGVTYRVEQHWQLARNEIPWQVNLAVMAAQLWREQQSFLRPRPPSWYHGIWSPISDWYADQALRQELESFYAQVPSNWVLCDLGVSRNDQPLALPPEMNAIIWRVLCEADTAARSWEEDPGSYRNDLYEPTAYVTDSEPVAARLDLYYERALSLEQQAQNLAFGVSLIGEIECVTLHPYTLFIANGRIVGCIGGDGRFDRLPPGLDECPIAGDALPTP